MYEKITKHQQQQQNLIALHSEAKSELWHYFKLITSGEIHHCLLTHTYSSIDLQNLYYIFHTFYTTKKLSLCLMSVMGIKTNSN